MALAMLATRQVRRAILVIVFLVIASTVFYSAPRLAYDQRQVWWQRPQSPSFSNPTPPTLSTSAPSPTTEPQSVNTQAIGPPQDYFLSPKTIPYCEARFSTKYLEEMRDHPTSYCAPEAWSNLTCFHSHSRWNTEQVDSLCVGQGVSIDAALGKFSMHCPMRQLTDEELVQGSVPFSQIREYWYETGPPRIFATGVDIHNRTPTLSIEDAPVFDDSVKNLADIESPASLDPPRTFLLLKREGEGNPWHCLVEIFSVYLTMDLLSISRDPLRGNIPFFDTSEEVKDTQVIILDERADGPFFDLWTYFARRPPIRLKQLMQDPATVKAVRDAKIIVPLAGSSNPLWEGPKVYLCNHVPTLSVFSQRVLEFYKVPEPAPRKRNDPIKVTFIGRKGRRLINQTALLDDINRRYPQVVASVIDFEPMPFAEQVRIIRDTDILVGVHGAGLTHIMFMRMAAGAVVEIQPKEVDMDFFRNLAYMRHIPYFRTHAKSVPQGSPSKRAEDMGASDLVHLTQRRRDWATEDVALESKRFLLVMDAAIKSVYNSGPWNFDVDHFDGENPILNPLIV